MSFRDSLPTVAVLTLGIDVADPMSLGMGTQDGESTGRELRWEGETFGVGTKVR